MARLTYEVAALVFVLIFGLEAIHYRNAVIEANRDRKRAWSTVVELRRSCATPPFSSTYR